MISINPIDIYKIFSDRFDQNSDRVAGYIDEISEDMEKLAVIWQEMVTSIVSGNSVDDEKLMSLGFHEYLPRNIAPYSRLRGFYERTSTVLAANHRADRVDDIVHRLARVILDRDSANEQLLNLLHQETGLSDKNQILKELTDTVNQINREAAEFRVLAKSVKAIGK